MIALGILIGVGPGYAYCVYWPPVHESKAEVLVMETRPYGSSGAGIVVVQPRDDPPTAKSSMVRKNGDFYNTRVLQDLEDESLRQSLQFLLDEGACVQQGVRLAKHDGANFDVRVVVLVVGT